MTKTRRDELEEQLEIVMANREVVRERVEAARIEWLGMEMDVLEILRNIRDLGGKDD